MAVVLVQESVPRLETQRWYLRRQSDAGDAEVRSVGMTVDQPRIGGAAEPAAVLSGPTQVAGVPDVLGQCDRRGQAAARTQPPDDGTNARPVIGGTQLGVLRVGRLVRHAG